MQHKKIPVPFPCYQCFKWNIIQHSIGKYNKLFFICKQVFKWIDQLLVKVHCRTVAFISFSFRVLVYFGVEGQEIVLKFGGNLDDLRLKIIPSYTKCVNVFVRNHETNEGSVFGE